MFVAAMLDAVPALVDRVLRDCRAVLPARVGTPVLYDQPRGSLRARGFGLAVTSREEPAAPSGIPAVAPAVAPAGAPDGAPGGAPSKPTASRYADLVDRIHTAPGLSEGTADQAAAILGLLAGAESRLHGVPVNDVHFHEIGDWDSLLDVVAAGSIGAALAEATWTVSPLPRGGGRVSTRHGVLPVPAPATLELLLGYPWWDDGLPGERVTPTGAAILRHLVGPAPTGRTASSARTGLADRPASAAYAAPGQSRTASVERLLAVGHGSGTRELCGCPNILVAAIHERVADGRTDLPGTHRVSVIEFDIDDMTGEELAVAGQLLRLVPGVLDVSTGQRAGKKHRPVTSYRILVDTRVRSLDALVRECFAQTTTLGVRIHDEDRVVLPRRAETVEAGGRTIRVKRASRGAEDTVKAESDEVTAGTLAARRALRFTAERTTPRGEGDSDE